MFVFASRRRHTRFSRDWSSDVCSSDLGALAVQDLQGAPGDLQPDQRHQQVAIRVPAHPDEDEPVDELAVLALVQPEGEEGVAGAVLAAADAAGLHLDLLGALGGVEDVRGVPGVLLAPDELDAWVGVLYVG